MVNQTDRAEREDAQHAHHHEQKRGVAAAVVVDQHDDRRGHGAEWKRRHRDDQEGDDPALNLLDAEFASDHEFSMRSPRDEDVVSAKFVALRALHRHDDLRVTIDVTELVVYAAMLVPFGRLADRYGRKQMFIAGLAVFVLASMACAVSADVWALVATGALAAAFGPTVGGVLTQISWHWVFLINIPIGAVLLWLAVVSIEDARPDARPDSRAERPDLWGAVLFASRRHPSPVIHPALLRIRSFRYTNLAMLSFNVAFAAQLLAGATRDLRPDQTATGSAIVTMSRQIGFVIGVSVLFVVVGTNQGVEAKDGFAMTWVISIGALLLAAVLATGMSNQVPLAVRVMR